MLTITEVELELRAMGRRLRQARLEGNETMALFARRIGVSVSTLRNMEAGESTVQVGYWANALWILGRLDELRGVLAPQADLISQARQALRAQRQRARPRAPRTGG
jgi:transcriptional regulator with XRE-family HTH domain